MSDQPSSRRKFLIGAAGAAAVIPILSHATAPAAQPAAQPAPVPPGYESLGPAEAAFVEAMVNVMCPADALTPNGVDCGLATFIDRQLAGGFGKGERYYPQNSGYNPTGPLGALSLRLGDDLNRYITNARML